jgi:hypothetical protein
MRGMTFVLKHGYVFQEMARILKNMAMFFRKWPEFLKHGHVFQEVARILKTWPCFPGNGQNF